MYNIEITKKYLKAQFIWGEIKDFRRKVENQFQTFLSFWEIHPKIKYSESRDLYLSVRSLLHIVGERAVALPPVITNKKKT